MPDPRHDAWRRSRLNLSVDSVPASVPAQDPVPLDLEGTPPARQPVRTDGGPTVDTEELMQELTAVKTLDILTKADEAPIAEVNSRQITKELYALDQELEHIHGELDKQLVRYRQRIAEAADQPSGSPARWNEFYYALEDREHALDVELTRVSALADLAYWQARRAQHELYNPEANDRWTSFADETTVVARLGIYQRKLLGLLASRQIADEELEDEEDRTEPPTDAYYDITEMSQLQFVKEAVNKVEAGQPAARLSFRFDACAEVSNHAPTRINQLIEDLPHLSGSVEEVLP